MLQIQIEEQIPVDMLITENYRVENEINDQTELKINSG